MKGLKELKEEFLQAQMKAKEDLANSKKGTEYKLRIPVPDKIQAKKNGAKWNAEAGYFAVRCADIEQHALKEFWVDNPAWIKIEGKIPFMLREPLKAHGLVSELNQETQEWSNWILICEKYQELAQTLAELDLLDLGGADGAA
jgi:hypothetical protein